MWESGFIHRLREPGHAGSNPAIQTEFRGRLMVGSLALNQCVWVRLLPPELKPNLVPKPELGNEARNGSVGNRQTTLFSQ